MLKLDDIKTLVIEASSRCNAACPFCSRQVKTREYPQQDITLEEFKRLPDDLIARLRQISFAGNFGDFACNSDAPAICAHIRSLSPDLKLFADSNGSVQSEAWWRELGQHFQQGKGFVSFALDGLSTTHALHRKQTNFEKIIANVKAFIGGGGVAYWKFIIFEHNEHEVEEARQMAKDLGFARFFAIPSRYYNDELHQPKGIDYVQRDPLYESHWEQVKDDEARCKPFHNRSLYIGADGTVLPCCYCHVQWFTDYRDDFEFNNPLLEKYYDQINFKSNDLVEIVEGPFFEELWAEAKKAHFCKLKCNPYTKKVRKDVIIADECFVDECLM